MTSGARRVPRIITGGRRRRKQFRRSIPLFLPRPTCYAGTAGGVIYDEGTVSSCENLAPIGNLRDYDWNFQKLWLSPAMKERRKKAADGCFCTHESNSYYPSLPFNPKHLIQIKRLEREMKKARRELESKEAQADGVAVKA